MIIWTCLIRILSWALTQGVQSTPVNSVQYANDNALILAKVFFSVFFLFFLNKS
jgi:hypothetical protein